MELANKEHPLIFSGPMVTAILEGRKTQTRRVMFGRDNGTRWAFLGSITDPNDYRCFHSYRLDNTTGIAYTGYLPVPCPYGKPGGRIWVRETWQQFPKTPQRGSEQKTLYAADFGEWAYNVDSDLKPWRSPIFMPRALSRITLEITDVRVERLQEISEEDAKAEGWPREFYNEPAAGFEMYPQQWFSCGWDTLNAKRGFGWDANPWVWMIAFKRVTE